MKGSIKQIHKIERKEIASPSHVQLLTSHQAALIAIRISTSELSLYELANDFRLIKSFSLPKNFTAMEVDPSGNYLAVRDNNRLYLMAADGTLKAEAEFSSADFTEEGLAFSSSGKFLWFASNINKAAKLWLLDASNLEILDTYSEHQYPWYEVALKFQPSANLLAVNNNCGDKHTELAFYSEQAGKIVKHPHNVSTDNDNDDFTGDGLEFHGIAPEQKFFTATDYYSFLWIWNWPDCTLREGICADDNDDETEAGNSYDMNTCGYFNNQILTGLINEDEQLYAIRALSVKSLKPIGDVKLPITLTEGLIDIFNDGLMVAYDDNLTVHIWQYISAQKQK